MIVIGDIHRDIKLLREIVEANQGEQFLQVGDLGLGDDPELDAEFRQFFDQNDVMFIRGNHDNLSVCQTMRGFIPDGSIIETSMGQMFCMGGAFSQYELSQGNNEVSFRNIYDMMETVRNVQPNVILSHDGPQFVIQDVIGVTPTRNRTRDFLNSIYDVSKPNLHMFGHHHRAYDVQHGNTRLICVGLDSYVHIPELRFVF